MDLKPGIRKAHQFYVSDGLWKMVRTQAGREGRTASNFIEKAALDRLESTGALSRESDRIENIPRGYRL